MLRVKQLFPFVVACLATPLCAQVKLSSWVVGSAGASGSTSTMKVAYTAGEVAVATLKTNNLTLTQGFHQPKYIRDLNLKVYSGFTPNKDGVNDTWIMDGIADLKPNTVMVFSRWGDKVWQGDDYDNSNVVWKGTNTNGDNVPDGTYFYVVTVPARTVTGWVQVTR